MISKDNSDGDDAVSESCEENEGEEDIEEQKENLTIKVSSSEQLDEGSINTIEGGILIQDNH